MGRPKLTLDELEARRIRINAKKRLENQRRRANPEYRAKELAKSRETRRNWPKEKRDHANEMNRVRHARRNGEQKTKTAQYMREYTLKRKYNLTPEERDAIFTKQGSKCACCESNEPGSVLGWSTDHLHAPPYTVRGVLCHKCNIRIGQLGDVLGLAVEKTQMYLSYLAKQEGLTVRIEVYPPFVQVKT